MSELTVELIVFTYCAGLIANNVITKVKSCPAKGLLALVAVP
jgi:hypothetical protein